MSRLWELELMPFDGTDFEPSPKKPPKRATPKERFLCAAAFIFALLLLVMPISASTFIDLVRYLAHK